MELFVNIVQAISFSGDNTNTANVNVASAWAGLNGSSATGAGTVCNVGFDDIAINDTTGTRNNGRIGDGRISRFMPTGAGGSTVLTRGGTDTGANWSQTSEVPPSMTQYVYSANAGDRDLYNLADISNVASINVVEEVVYALNSDASAGSMAPTIQSGSTVSEAAAQALSVAAAHYHARWETDPNTGAAWTAAAINALQAGATVR
jgi:hypothetical protein